MRIQSRIKGTKGWISLYNDIIQQSVLSDKQKDILRYRVKVIDHFRLYGLDSAMNAFNESRATIYRWNKVLNDTKGNIYKLAPQSTKPIQNRISTVPLSVYDFIQRHKELQPKLGKDKISFLIKRNLGLSVSASTVQRIINELKKRNVLKPFKKVHINGASGKLHIVNTIKRIQKTRRNNYIPDSPGQLFQMDSIVCYHNGNKYYFITTIDVYTRKAYCIFTHSHSSTPTAEFLAKLKEQYPDTVIHVQTDNGSEFMKHFEEACTNLNITHFWNYPRCPKQNAFIERFNRTIQEECINNNKHLLHSKDKMIACINGYISWYNSYRPHWSLGLLTPDEYTRKYYQETGFVSNV